MQTSQRPFANWPVFNKALKIVFSSVVLVCSTGPTCSILVIGTAEPAMVPTANILQDSRFALHTEYIQERILLTAAFIVATEARHKAAGTAMRRTYPARCIHITPTAKIDSVLTVFEYFISTDVAFVSGARLFAHF